MQARKHVLVVEDDPLVAEVVLDALSDTYRVSHAGDAAAALATIRQGPVDLMLLDCTLPGGLGQELIPAVYATGIRLILMSGDPASARRVPGQRTFLQKPFTLAALLDYVARALAT